MAFLKNHENLHACSEKLIGLLLRLQSSIDSYKASKYSNFASEKPSSN